MPPKRNVASRTLSAHIDTSEEEPQDEVVPQKVAPARRPASRGGSRARSVPAVEKKSIPARSSRRKPVSRSEEATVDDETVGAKEDDGKGAGDGTGDEADELDVAPVRPKRSAPEKVEPPKKVSAKSKPKGKKSILKEVDPVTEGGNAGESVEVELEEPEPKPKRGGRKVSSKLEVVVEKKKRLTKKELAAAKKREEEKEEEEEEEEEDEGEGGGGKEIAETQYTPMQVDARGPAEDEVAPTPTQVHTSDATSKRISVEKKKPTVSKGRGRSNKLHEQIPEDHEGGSDEDDLSMPTRTVQVALRKGKQVPSGTAGGGSEAYRELEKKLQELEAQYKKLEFVRETEPERALEMYRKESQQREKGKISYTERLIDSMQSDLNAQTALSSETRILKKKLAAKEAEVTKLQTKIQELNRSLQEQQNETKVLSAKLSVAQSQRAATVPGSAVKPGIRGGQGAAKSNGIAGGPDDAWVAKMKEDLFADLTGLLIMSVKKEAQGPVFECLQTGGNGTAIHFKLLIPNNSVKRPSKPPASNANGKDSGDEEGKYDDVVYTPLLDEERDKAVLSVLPRFLRNEIGFDKDGLPDFFHKMTLFMINFKRNPDAELDSSETSEDEGEEEDEGDEEDEED